MILADIPQGASVFVDANTLVYHFTADPQYGQARTDFVGRQPLAYRVFVN